MVANSSGSGTTRELRPALPSANGEELPANAPSSVPAVKNPEKAKLPVGSKKKPKKESKPKVFVLDTNVLMHEPMALGNFANNHVYIPTIVIEELDNNKKGRDEHNRNARAATRDFEKLMTAYEGNIVDGIPLNLLKRNRDEDAPTGKLFFQTTAVPEEERKIASLEFNNNDNLILATTKWLPSQPEFKGLDVVLVSKDVNMRLKARLLGIPVEDYTSDMVIDDSDVLSSGMITLPVEFWNDQTDMQSRKRESITEYKIFQHLELLQQNHLLLCEDDHFPETVVTKLTPEYAILETLIDFTSQKNAVYGVCARNREQNFALNLLMNPDIHLVSLAGEAGTGKTLLTLAAGLAQIAEDKLYRGIICTRALVSTSEDMGFLPGTEKEKMDPWMGALYDNLEVLVPSDAQDKVDHKLSKKEAQLFTNRQIMDRYIEIKNLGFMRGRTFLERFIIIDEVQNLTPKQVKMLISRAGMGTKVVLLGNNAQIDTPYLNEASSGLTVAVDRFKGREHAGHVLLKTGERSWLATTANEVL